MIIKTKRTNIIINKLKLLTKGLLNNHLFKSNSIDNCPHCKSTYFVKYGKFNNSQRFKCKECLRTFCESTNTTRYYSKKGADYWQKYISIMFDHTSLRASSSEVKINLKTAFVWRHKLLYTLNSITETNELKDCVEMRKIFLKENHKGNRTNLINKRRKVWVIASSDSNDDTFAKPISLGLWKKRNFDKLIYSKINRNSYIKTSGDSYIKSIALKHNQDKIEKSSPNSKVLINHFVGNIKGIISNCHGVATKYLPHYFSLAKIISLVKECDVLDLLDSLSLYNSYITGKRLKGILPSYQIV